MERRERRTTTRWEPAVDEPKKRRKGAKKRTVTAAENKAELVAKKKAAKKAAQKAAQKANASLSKGSSAYGLFVGERKAALEASGMEKKEARAVVAAEWKALDVLGRRPWAERAQASKDAVEAHKAAKEAKEWLAKLEAESKAAARARKAAGKKNTQAKKTRVGSVPTLDSEFYLSVEHLEADEWDEKAWAYRAHGGSCRRVASVDYSDDHCTVCCDGGKLVLCASCPRAFHTNCLRDVLGEAAPGDADFGLLSDRRDTAGDLGGNSLGAKSKKRGRKPTKNKTAAGQRVRAHAPDPLAVVGGQGRGAPLLGSTARPEVDWHCPVCVRSHVPACMACGEGGDAETRLVPCRVCPRAYHIRCGGLELVDEPGRLGFRCAGCDAEARPALVKEEADDNDKTHARIEEAKQPDQPHCDDSDGQDKDDNDVVIEAPAAKKRRLLLDAALETTTLQKIVRLCAALPRSHFASVLGSRLERAVALATTASRDPSTMARCLAAIPALHSPEAVCSRLQFAAHTTAPTSTPRPTATELSRRSSSAVSAKVWDEAATKGRRAQFALDGICCVPGALDTELVTSLRDRALAYYEDVIHTIRQLNLQEDLGAGGFATFKGRDRGRFDLVVPRLGDGPELRDTPWLPLVKEILGPRARLCHVGVIIALPDAASQKWHSDGDHIHPDLHLPPHALNVFVPLVDVSSLNGATEFAPGSHADWAVDDKLVVDARAGDAIVFDWRLRHRGLANRQTHARPILYATYALPFFLDRYNFSSDRYATLPPLVPRLSREDRAKKKLKRGQPVSASTEASTSQTGHKGPIALE